MNRGYYNDNQPIYNIKYDLLRGFVNYSNWHTWQQLQRPQPNSKTPSSFCQVLLHGVIFTKGADIVIL